MRVLAWVVLVFLVAWCVVLVALALPWIALALGFR